MVLNHDLTTLGSPSPPASGSTLPGIYGLSRDGKAGKGHFLSPIPLFSNVLLLSVPLVSRNPGWNQRKSVGGQGVHVASLDHPPAGAALGRPRTTPLPEGAFLFPHCHHEDAGEEGGKSQQTGAG